MAFLFLDKEHSEFKKRAGSEGVFTKELDRTYKLAKSGDAEAQFEIYDVCSSLGMVDESLSWLAKSAEGGCSSAEYIIGKYIYENGRIDIESQSGYNLAYEDAEIWLEHSAEHGCADAACLLAHIMLGKDAPDEESAASWYIRSYELGGKCDYAFTARHCLGKGDRDTALELCKIAAGSGDRRSIVTAGRLLIENGEYANAEEYLSLASETAADVEVLYLMGLCREKMSDFEAAAEHYKKADTIVIAGLSTAADEVTDALYERLGDLFYLGKGTDPNLEKAVLYYSKVRNFTSEESKRNFASCKFTGDGTERDINTAAELGLPEALYEQYMIDCTKVDLLRKAAEQGYAPARYELGKLNYEKGEYDQAILELLPVHGAYDEVAFILGVCFTKTGNYQQARSYFELAADKGDSEAEYLVGRFYASGLGVAADQKKAVEWFKRSAANGNPTGAYELGMCCKNGIGTAKNPARGMNLIRAAAENGCAPAMYEYANCLRLGSGVEQDKDMAITYYTGSAERGFEPAMYQLGFMNELGQITGARDLEEALRWYKKCRKKYKDVAARISACILEINNK